MKAGELLTPSSWEQMHASVQGRKPLSWDDPCPVPRASPFFFYHSGYLSFTVSSMGYINTTRYLRTSKDQLSLVLCPVCQRHARLRKRDRADSQVNPKPTRVFTVYKKPRQQWPPGSQATPHQAFIPLVRIPEARCCSSSRPAVEGPLLQRGTQNGRNMMPDQKAQRQMSRTPMHMQQSISGVPEISNT